MQRIITLFVSAYWTAYFGLLAFVAFARVTGASAVPEGIQATFGLGVNTESAPALAVALAFGCALSAALFAWTLLDAVARPGTRRTDVDDVARLALGVSMGLTTLILILGAARPEGGPVDSTFIQFIALLASYVAIHLEQSALGRRRTTPADEPASMARMMALGAAHTSLLPRLPGRAEGDAGKSG